MSTQRNTKTEDHKSQAWLMVGTGGRIKLGSPTTPQRARQAAQRTRQTRPLGSSDWVEVRQA